MKSFFICLLLFAFTITNAQTKMYINKNSGGTDSIALSDIKTITFKTSVNNYAFFFADSFNSDLSKWTQYKGEDYCNGVWQIINGELYGNYSISCGSTSNPQSKIILNDAYQPNTTSWMVVVNFKMATDPNFPAYKPVGVGFSLFESENKNIFIGFGGGGDNPPTWIDSIGIGYDEWNGSQRINSKSKMVGFKFNTTITHKAALEKKGNNYKMYLDDIYIGEWVDNYLNGQGKVGLHTYGPKLLDNFVIYK